MLLRYMRREKAFMCHNCSEQVRIIGDELNFKNSDMEILLTNSQKCCSLPDWTYQYTRNRKG